MEFGQEINVVINFHAEASSYTILTKNRRSLKENESLKLLQTKLDFGKELQCEKCSQSLQLNIFLVTDAVDIKVESCSDEIEECVKILHPIKKQDDELESDKHQTIVESDELEDSNFDPPNDATDSDPEINVPVKKLRRVKKNERKVSKQLENHSDSEELLDCTSAVRQIKCCSSSFDPEHQLWYQKLLNGDTITTNFDLDRRICDICGKPRGRRSTSEFLKHRASHFMGRKFPTKEKTECSYYCLACDKSFEKTAGLDIHSRTCEQKYKLIDRWATKETSPKLHMLIPDGVILPELPNKKEGYFLQVTQEDRTIAYVEHLPDSKYTHVTNFNPRKRRCDICQQPTKDAKSLRAHRKFHFFQLLNDENCVACGEKFTELDKRTQHTLYCKKKDVINPNACVHCNHIARNFTKLRFHISAKHGPSKDYHKPSVLCHLCSQTVLKEHLENHLRRHETSDGKAYECDHCAKRFSSVSGIKEHLTRLHFPHLANYRCHLCDFGTRTEHVFKLHLLNKHEIGKEQATGFPCSLCNQILKTTGSLRQHMVNFHTNPKEKRKYTCDVCNKSFFSKYNLEKHSYIHKPDHEKPYRCKYCNKGFGDKHKFSQHEATHDNTSNLFYCPTCGKGMKYKQSLETHIRMHTGEQPFHCQVCNKKFADRGNYRQHMKNHEKELGIKLTYTAEERRLMKLKLLEPQQLIGLDM